MHNRPALYRGELIVTKYRLMFVTKPPDAIQVETSHADSLVSDATVSLQVLVDVPLGMISQIEKVGGQARSQINDGAAYGIEINCKVERWSMSSTVDAHRCALLGSSPFLFR